MYARMENIETCSPNCVLLSIIQSICTLCGSKNTSYACLVIKKCTLCGYLKNTSCAVNRKAPCAIYFKMHLVRYISKCTLCGYSEEAPCVWIIVMHLVRLSRKHIFVRLLTKHTLCGTWFNNTRCAACLNCVNHAHRFY